MKPRWPLGCVVRNTDLHALDVFPRCGEAAGKADPMTANSVIERRSLVPVRPECEAWKGSHVRAWHDDCHEVLEGGAQANERVRGRARRSHQDRKGPD